ncbi:MAG: hypothetical protein QGD90_07870 [Candidatus Hydrogenedentes bacterium]|nr:hypothetical protein [Candidatus Hydrogenedentota bacterium]
MSQFTAVLQVKRRIAGHQIASIRNESLLKVSVVGSAAVLLWYGVLRSFGAGFYYLQARAFEGEPVTEAVTLADILMVRLLSIFALALFFMLIFSNVLIAFSTLYKAREVQYLLQAPLSVRTLFLSRFIECVSFSSWASAYLGSPLIIAYGVSTSAHWIYYVAAVVFYVPFVTIPAAIGCIITLLLVRILPRLPRFALFLLAGIAIVWLFTYLRESFSAERLAEDTVVTLMIQATSHTQSPFLPSHWASQGILAAAQGAFGQMTFLFLLLLSNAMMAIWLASQTAHLVFFPGFSGLVGGDRNVLRPRGRGILGRLERALVFLREPVRSLVVKDIKLFWRDPSQWTQFVIFFGIMAVYIANLGNRGLEIEGAMYRSWVASMNSGACALILASLTSRFVYPLISLEGFRFWILGLAPLTKRQLIWQKYWLSVATTTPVTLGLTLMSCYFLEVSTIHFAVAVYTICLANLTLAGLAVGLGSLYPNFEEDNPARIVSGMGGTLNFLLSVGYITVVIGSQMLVLQWDVMRHSADTSDFIWALSIVLLFNALLSLAAALLPMRLGLRNLIQTEF